MMRLGSGKKGWQCLFCYIHEFAYFLDIGRQGLDNGSLVAPKHSPILSAAAVNCCSSKENSLASAFPPGVASANIYIWFTNQAEVESWKLFTYQYTGVWRITRGPLLRLISVFQAWKQWESILQSQSEASSKYIIAEAKIIIFTKSSIANYWHPHWCQYLHHQSYQTGANK